MATQPWYCFFNSKLMVKFPFLNDVWWARVSLSVIVCVFLSNFHSIFSGGKMFSFQKPMENINSHDVRPFLRRIMRTHARTHEHFVIHFLNFSKAKLRALTSFWYWHLIHMKLHSTPSHRRYGTLLRFVFFFSLSRILVRACPYRVLFAYVSNAKESEVAIVVVIVSPKK